MEADELKIRKYIIDNIDDENKILIANSLESGEPIFKDREKVFEDNFNLYKREIFEQFEDWED